MADVSPLTDSKLTLLLIKKEIAKRNIRSSAATLFLIALTSYFAFAIAAFKVAILACTLVLLVSLAVRVYFSKKFLETPEKENYWFISKLTHWLNAILVAMVLIITVSNIEPTSSHYLVLFTLLASFVSSLLFTTALDTSLFLPSLAIVFISLVSVTLNLTTILIADGVLIIYAFLQYLFLKKQLLDTIGSQLQLIKSNQELRKKDSQQEYFVKLIFKLLSNDEPLDTIFKTLIEFFEELNPQTICSILFLDKNKKRFEKVYAPHLPEFYNQALPQLDIGVSAGSCGTAAYLGKRVIVDDIQTDPLWAPYRELAQAANVAACWSQPIIAQNGEVLGTFAIYHAVKHTPSDRDIQTIEQAANLVAIILNHFETKKIAQKAQERISLIYESSIDSMWLIAVEDNGQTYRFKSINDAFIAITGLTRAAVLEKTIEEVLPATSIPLIRSKYGEAVSTGHVVDYLEISPLPSGVKVGQIRVKPIKDENGVVTKILGIAEDVTEKKRIDDRLKESEADLLYAQHVARLGSWKWEAKTDTVHWSQEIYNILNLDPNTAPLPFIEQSKLYTEESWDKLKAAVQQAMASGGSYEVDLEGRSTKKPRWFVARGEVTEKDEQGNPTRLAGTLQDNTERKLLENNLKAALNARDEFIAVATHELKTPLTTLQLALYSILKGVDGAIDKDKIASRVEKAKIQGDRLEALIKNLLDVTSIGAGKMRLELKPDVNFSALIQNITKKYEDDVAKSGSSLIKNIEPNIIGLWDDFRLEQIITNLLSNAIKYGNGKPIEIHLRRVGDKALLEVRDQGIGISEDKQKKVFERFERAVSETSYSGLGLGLWIVKEIVTAFNGKVWVTSTLHKGSCFSVELPIKAQG